MYMYFTSCLDSSDKECGRKRLSQVFINENQENRVASIINLGTRKREKKKWKQIRKFRTSSLLMPPVLPSLKLSSKHLKMGYCVSKMLSFPLILLSVSSFFTGQHRSKFTSKFGDFDKLLQNVNSGMRLVLVMNCWKNLQMSLPPQNNELFHSPKCLGHILAFWEPTVEALFCFISKSTILEGKK